MRGMDIKSAITGAGAVVLVAGGVFFAVSASNAQEQVEPEVAVEDTYDGPYVYWQAPEPLPHITVPPPAPEPVVVVEPEPVVVEEEPVVPEPESKPEEPVEPAPLPTEQNPDEHGNGNGDPNSRPAD